MSENISPSLKKELKRQQREKFFAEFTAYHATLARAVSIPEALRTYLAICYLASERRSYQNQLFLEAEVNDLKNFIHQPKTQELFGDAIGSEDLLTFHAVIFDEGKLPSLLIVGESVKHPHRRAANMTITTFGFMDVSQDFEQRFMKWTTDFVKERNGTN